MGKTFRKQKITSEVVNGLQPGDTVADTDLPGYHVTCQQVAKVYFVRKHANGRRHFVTIGEHGVMGLTERRARDEAMVVLAALKNGRDPSAERAKAKGMPTLGDYALEYFDRCEGSLKASTLKDFRSTLKNHIEPSPVAKIRLDKVEREHMAQLHRKLKGKPRTANKVLQIVSIIYGEAQRAGLVQDGFNPASKIKHYKIDKRQRFLSAEELARLGKAMADYDAEEKHGPYTTAAIRLLMFTGARLNEILTLRWEWVDMERGLVNLPDSKTGQKTIQLSAPALEILAALPRLKGNPHVIPGHVTGRHLVNLAKPWRAIRDAAGLEPITLKTDKKQEVRIHDLRHSFASLAINGGASLPMIGALLGHTQAQTTMRYAHLAADTLRNANDAAGRKAAAAMSGETADVVPFERRK